MRAEALEQAPDAGAGDHGEHAAAGALGNLAGPRRDLGVHVRDVEVRDLAGACQDRDRLLGLVGVDMDLQRAGVADDQHRVAERRERRGETAWLEPPPGDGEVGAVAKGRREVLWVGYARRRVMLERRGLVAAQGGHDPGEDHDQRVTAGIDDAGVAQHGEQIGRAHHRGLAGGHGPFEHAGDRVVLLHRGDLRAQARVGHVRQLDHHAMRHLAHDGENRALGGLAHRGVGAVGCAGERGADQRRVDQLAGPAEQLLGRAVDEL